MERPVIQLEGISKFYTLADEKFIALNKVSLNIEKNDYVAITGPSGSGKSTLMNIIGCLDIAEEGEYWLNQVNASSQTDAQLAAVRNRHIGFIFQSFNLFPKLSVIENVAYPLVYQKVGKKEREKRAKRQLERVGLGDKLQHLPNQLSGGQRQRVAIARALVTNPAILLGDEPTGNLDSKTTSDIMALFDELYNEGQTIVLVTHEPDIAEHCLREVRLVDGEIAHDVRREKTIATNVVNEGGVVHA
ncbi:macrolide ABC transporter ATP-binding protein [Veronia nyctiphanis]|uniref:Macrolide ABC transporter ATP-binding protein n=2 Tax=Veronia nyctiphanis TaxID=1278244 RepID=A0A4Q0YKW5_9GAMM|nr:macrolide ABC transporter ATP-binding protein [Veronia nyctiphanis]